MSAKEKLTVYPKLFRLKCWQQLFTRWRFRTLSALRRHFTKHVPWMEDVRTYALFSVDQETFYYFEFELGTIIVDGEEAEGRVPKTWLPNAKYILHGRWAFVRFIPLSDTPWLSVGLNSKSDVGIWLLLSLFSPLSFLMKLIITVFFSSASIHDFKEHGLDPNLVPISRTHEDPVFSMILSMLSLGASQCRPRT